MREIKFRGINYYSGKWIYGILVLFKPKAPEIYDFKNDSIEIVIEETLGQYTGLKDINGVEIYEGDVVEIDMNHYQIKATVIYREDLMAFVFDHPKGVESMFEILKDHVEVIGNIHEEVE